MRKKLVILIVALALLAGFQVGLRGSASASSDTCETFCSEDLEGCLCCSTCCRSESGEVICTPGACICP